MTDIRTIHYATWEKTLRRFSMSALIQSRRWIKTGNVPIKKAEKICAAMEALEKSQVPEPVQPSPR